MLPPLLMPLGIGKLAIIIFYCSLHITNSFNLKRGLGVSRSVLLPKWLSKINENAQLVSRDRGAGSATLKFNINTASYNYRPTQNLG